RKFTRRLLLLDAQ
ncbi:hypothetical protein V3C99_009225, partial [Haemonchus contortus]